MKKQPKPADRSHTLNVEALPGEPPEGTVARYALMPPLLAAATVLGFTKFGSVEFDINALAAELRAQSDAVSRNDLTRPEALLTAQAHTLDAIFNSLAQRAALNMGQYVDAADRYMRLALKAQSQCRATLETLAAIKNPPVVFARQANIAHGPQQVNNGEPTRTREIQSEPSKLLEQTHGERLDTRAAGQASGGNPAMEALGAVHGAEDSGR